MSLTENKVIRTDIPSEIRKQVCLFYICIYYLYPDEKCRAGQSIITFDSCNGFKCSAAALPDRDDIAFVNPVHLFINRSCIISGQHILPKNHCRHLMKSPTSGIVYFCPQ